MPVGGAIGVDWDDGFEWPENVFGAGWAIGSSEPLIREEDRVGEYTVLSRPQDHATAWYEFVKSDIFRRLRRRLKGRNELYIIATSDDPDVPDSENDFEYCIGPAGIMRISSVHGFFDKKDGSDIMYYVGPSNFDAMLDELGGKVYRFVDPAKIIKFFEGLDLKAEDHQRFVVCGDDYES